MKKTIRRKFCQKLFAENQWAEKTKNREKLREKPAYQIFYQKTNKETISGNI